MDIDLTKSDDLTIGVVSDTHGRLSKKTRSVLGRADVIIHAGDFDTPEIMAALETLAPVIAVRGNMDHGDWAAELPGAEMVELGGLYFYILHNLNGLDLDPATAGVKVVISGHTHQAATLQTNGILFMNPGSPTSPRNGTYASVAMLTVRQGQLRHRLVSVED